MKREKHHELAVLFLAAGGTGCGFNNSHPPPSEPRPPALASTAVSRERTQPSERLVGVREGKLVMLELPQGRVSILAAWAPDWCATDGKESFTWATRVAGSHLELYAVESNGVDHLIAATLPETTTPFDMQGTSVVIEYPDGSYVGEHDRVTPRIALHVKLTPPSIFPEVYCEGDASWYCYDEQDRLLPEYTRLQAALARVALIDKAFLRRALYTGAGARLFTRTQQPGKVTVDESQCVEEPRCGDSHPLGSTSYRLVVISNDRGDYFYEAMQLYDSHAGEFVHVHDPKRRSKTRFLEESNVEGMEVSPSGTFYAIHRGGTNASSRYHVHAFDGSVTFPFELVCGWLEGGLRVGGPTER